MDVVQGADFKFSSTFVDKEGYLPDLTDGVARTMIKINIGDADVSAVVSLNSTDDPTCFDFSEGNLGKITVRIPGNLLGTETINEKKKYFVQTEVLVNTDEYYRSNIEPFIVTESLFKS